MLCKTKPVNDFLVVSQNLRFVHKPILDPEACIGMSKLI